MNYGLYLSASGVLTNMYRQDVFSNNLANSQTVGYKPDVPAVRPREPESIEEGFGFELRQKLLDRLGGGVFAGRQSINFSAGRVEPTGNNLDVALKQSDRFFAVGVTDPETRQRLVHLTRDGRFTTDSDGFLAMVNGGHQVLDANDEPIQPGAGSLEIDAAGRLVRNGEVLGQIQVATVSDMDVLRKRGGNLFRVEGPDRLRRTVENPAVMPGFVERSGTDPIKELMKLIAATKAVTGNGNLIRYHDSMLDRAVNVLGRVVA